MIDSILVENFQSHKSTLLQLSQGVNVIKGVSHSGKSSIIRAIKWVLFNRPSGTPFKPFFSDEHAETLVAISFNDGKSVNHIRGKKLHTYMVTDGEHTTSLTALGTDVPEEVTTVLNMNEINYLSQHEGYYLLQDSAGAVAKLLNQLVGIDIIDKCFEESSRRITGLNSDIKYTEIDIKTNEEEFKKFVDLEEKERRIEELDVLFNRMVEVKSKVDSIYELKSKIKSLIPTLTEINEFLLVENEFKKIEKLIEKSNSTGGDLQNILFLIGSIKKNKFVLESLSKILPVEEPVKYLYSIEATYNEKLLEVSGIANKVKSIKNSRGEYILYQEEEGKCIAAYEYFLDKQKICPLCEQPFRR